MEKSVEVAATSNVQLRLIEKSGTVMMKSSTSLVEGKRKLKGLRANKWRRKTAKNLEILRQTGTRERWKDYREKDENHGFQGVAVPSPDDAEHLQSCLV
mmetsp:Transcript_94678/g.164271  ORF Transcript_94678/g.164271 Transcript_94678/m.164271 type:complete len:99 (+) Transcript_94678:102-398(+)